MGWRGLAAVAMHTRKEVYVKKRHAVVIEKDIEDVRQGPKIDPDLLESIMSL